VIQIKENGDIWMNNRLVDAVRIPANIETMLTQHNHTQVLVMQMTKPNTVWW
jgi:hypothetical protein